jgi:hypothetical protein
MLFKNEEFLSITRAVPKKGQFSRIPWEQFQRGDYSY